MTCGNVTQYCCMQTYRSHGSGREGASSAGPVWTPEAIPACSASDQAGREIHCALRSVRREW